VFDATLLTFYTLKTALALLVIVTVIVSALPLSFETNNDLKIATVAAGAVYKVVTSVEVKSTFAFL